MRPIARFLHLMSSSVAVAARSGMDAYGKPTYDAAVSYRAHLTGKRTLVRTAGGQDLVSTQSAYLATAAQIDATAQVTLSTADVGSTAESALHPPILAVERRYDGTGPHHVVLRLG